MENIITILTDFDLVEETASSEALASAISLNPNVSWATFVFTDDQPNINKQRIPTDEFVNIVNTGVHMPIKMATGKIEDGHDKSVPLGTIAQLKIDGNKVLGLAALWLSERPEDIKLLKSKHTETNKPQLSWEVYYKDVLLDEETQVKTLKDVCVRATTVVGMPAYAGRTPILAMSSDESKSAEEKNVEELQKQYDALKAEFDTLKTELLEKTASIETLTTELTTLREFKSSIDKEKADEEKMSVIEKKFSEAGIEKTKEYFTEKRPQFLGLEESEIDFLIQELVAFAPKQAEASEKKPALPNLTATTFSKDPKELAKALLEQAIIVKK